MALINFNSVDLNRKIKIGLGSSIVILILASAVSYYNIRQLIDQSWWVNHTNEVLANVESTLSAIKDGETSQRGYLLTGDKGFLKIYSKSYDNALKSYQKVKEMTSDNPLQQQNLITLEKLMRQRFDRLQYVLDVYQKDHRISTENMILGRAIMLQTRAVIDQMKQEENRLLKIRTEEAKKLSNLTPILIILMSLFAVIISGVSLYFISRDIDTKAKIQKETVALNKKLSESNEEIARSRDEINRQNYMLSGLTQLNDLLRGERNLNQLGGKIIMHICEYLNAHAGALYIQDEDRVFYLTNSYAWEQDRNFSFKSGETILGQTAQQKKIILLDDVPADSIKIRTGSSVIDPVQILLVPFYYNDETIAVVELINKNNFSTNDLEYVKTLGDIITISINGIKAENKTLELLAETQNQAEELESQQEELRQMNAELKTSEEELKASQEELQEKNSELEEKAQLLEEQFEAVRTKNTEVEQARTAIEVKMKEVETVSKYKSEFLANMSHELRTPLNSILILSRIISDNQDGNLQPKQIEHAQIIHNSGNDLLRLINDILDLSKIESGQVKLELSDLKIHDLHIQSLFEHEARQKDINFSTAIDEKLPKLMRTDRFRLEQILKNLLSNAFKFTPKGGSVDFKIFVPESNTDFNSQSLKTSESVIGFSVRDTGIGIASEKQQAIFEAFQQADASTTRKYGGTGLGLAISKELANLLGGEINLVSEENKGSEFILYLPLSTKVQSQSPVSKSKESISSFIKNITPLEVELKNQSQETSIVNSIILIIEDDKGFNNILADFAIGRKFKIYQAYNGKDGIELAKKHKPKAILLDINLPDISGWQVLEEIRKDKSLKDVQVHVMSAYDKEIIGKSEEHQDYLPKPVTLEMLDKAFSSIAENSSGPIQKILIVEDNKNENKAISELLMAHKMQSVSAHSGSEALEKLGKQSFDCIILDLNLPDVGGYELMKKIKEVASFAATPIIIYSGKDLSEEEENKLKRFANTIIIKNEFSYIRLLDEVQLFLHKVNSKLPGDDDYEMKLHVPEEILKGKKVLLVDDDVRNVYSLYSLLEKQAMTIVVANDGKEALEKLNQEKEVDIILMDIMMPEMDGIEATKRIRQNINFKNIPIIALTAKAMRGDKEKCIEAGASDYISKPVDIDKLLTLMRVWLYQGS